MKNDCPESKELLKELNKDIKQLFKDIYPELKDEKIKDEVNKEIDEFFNYDYIINGNTIEKKVIKKVNDKIKLRCGDPSKIYIKKGIFKEDKQI